MKFNQIEVLFFSKNLQLLNTFLSIFSDEIDFSYCGLSNFDELAALSETWINSVLIIDFSDDFYDLDYVSFKSNVRLLSIPIVFISNNRKLNVDFEDEGFTCFEVISKPVGVNDLLMIIRNLLGIKMRPNEPAISIRGNWFIPKKNAFEDSQGTSIRLTEKETKIISFLYEGRGEVRSKDLILTAIWGYKGKISTHTLETHIYRLRKKLKIGLNEKDLILKSPEGYFLNLF
jgi:DNA-binding response OmpR family regulator